jgi:MFS family permease
MNVDPPPHPAPPAADTRAFAPLADPVFRMLWVAWLTANVCMWMNDVAAAWLMTQITPDPAWVALVQTASTLPVFLLGLPSGAMADIVDRRRWFMFTQFWVAATAVLLCALAFADALNAPLLLFLVFVNGVGLALRWPVFAAIVPEVVPRAQLSAALALNGVAMNASRIAGPIVAGALLASLGSPWVFALNALLSVGTAFIIFRWRNVARASALPGERFVGAMRVGLQYVRQSPRLRVILLRIFVFFLQSTALVALLPLLARQIGGGAGTYTLLLASMGVGAIVAGLAMVRLRAAWTRDRLVTLGTVVHAAATVAAALSDSVWLTAPAMAAAGAAWITAANSLTLAAQFALPDWVRARGMSIYQMALMAGAAGGAALWGQVASRTDLRTGLLASAALALALVLLLRGRRIDDHGEEDLTPQGVQPELKPAIPIEAHDGPVMVTIEYLIDEADRPVFVELMQDLRRMRLRSGALSWGLFRDSADPRRHVEYFVDESWVEHLRRFDRVTASDLALRARRNALHRGDGPPKVQRYVAESMLS